MDKCAIITGASKGIGLACAQRFLDEGYRVINISRMPCNLDVKNLSLDLSDLNAIEQARDDLHQLIGSPEQICLVNNAGALSAETVADFNTAEFERIMKINLMAPAILARIALQRMKQGSSIIYLGSTLSEQAVPNKMAYVTSKHALVGLMRSTCQDVGDKGISTCLICPGFTRTELVEEHLKENPAAMDFIKHKVLAGRMIEPTEMAELIYHTAINPIVNGSVIHANLGQRLS